MKGGEKGICQLPHCTTIHVHVLDRNVLRLKIHNLNYERSSPLISNKSNDLKIITSNSILILVNSAGYLRK